LWVRVWNLLKLWVELLTHGASSSSHSEHDHKVVRSRLLEYVETNILKETYSNWDLSNSMT
jgi:hypothetical protein